MGTLRRFPSASDLTAAGAEALLPAHRRLAEAERERGPPWPWRADNSVHVEPYDSRAHALGSEAGAEFVADFHTAATAAALAAIDRVRSGAQRRPWLAFDLMVTTAHAFAAGGVSHGFVSFRAHADVFLAGTRAPRTLRADWDRRYSLTAGALRATLEEVVTEVDSIVEGAVDSAAGATVDGPAPVTVARTARGAAPAGSPVSDWLAVLGRVRDRGFALVDSGELAMEQAPAGWQPPPGASPFLRELITNADFHRWLMPATALQRYRLLLNLLYLQMTRLGVRPVERHLLCHLAANAVEDRYGVDAVHSLRASARGAGRAAGRAR